MQTMPLEAAPTENTQVTTPVVACIGPRKSMQPLNGHMAAKKRLLRNSPQSLANIKRKVASPSNNVAAPSGGVRVSGDSSSVCAKGDAHVAGANVAFANVTEPDVPYGQIWSPDRVCET